MQKGGGTARLMAHGYSYAASRGRGRGLSSDPSKKSEDGKRTPKSIGELAKYLHSLDERNLDAYGAEFAGMVRRYADDEVKVSEVIKLIFDTTVASRDYSVLGACVCKLIIDSEHASTFGSDFLRRLLTRFQSEIKNSKDTRSKSIEQWLGVFAFLCEIYCKIKISGEPITVVGKSILQNAEKILYNSDTVDDEIDVLCTKLKVCGKLLEEQDPALMENILGTLRRQVIRGGGSCQRRCFIMEVIELKQLGWTDRTGSVDKFYADALPDAVAEDEVGR